MPGKATLSDAQIESLREAFDSFDEDGNETITPEELKTLMERVLGGDIPQEQIDSIIKSIDADDSGTIDFDEFIDLMSDSKFDFLDEHKAAFEMFDKDGNGRISVHELKDVFGKLGQRLDDEQIQAMIEEADLDGDQEIDFEEFKTMLKF